MSRFITLSFERLGQITSSYISWVQPNFRYFSRARNLRTTTAHSCARSFLTILSTVGLLNIVWLNGGLTEVMSHDNKMNSGHIFKWPIKKCWRAGVTNFDGYSHHSSMQSWFLTRVHFWSKKLSWPLVVLYQQPMCLNWQFSITRKLADCNTTNVQFHELTANFN